MFVEKKSFYYRLKIQKELSFMLKLRTFIPKDAFPSSNFTQKKKKFLIQPCGPHQFFGFVAETLVQALGLQNTSTF